MTNVKTKIRNANGAGPNKIWRVARALGVLLLMAPSAQGAEIYEFYTGVRQMGMGGAYTAIVNDETALLTNPAGLGKIRDVIVTLADPELSGSATDLEITKIDNFTKAFSPQDLLGLLNDAKGKHWNAKAQVFPSIVAPNVGIGLHAKSSYDAEVNSAGTTYRLDYTNDYAAALGFCFRFFSGIVKLGVSGRYVDRTEIHKDLPASSPAVDINTVASEGTGFAGDVGLILTAPVAWLPTLAATVRDAGNTSYALNNGSFHQTTSRPADTKQTVDAGLALFPIFANHTRVTFTLEMHDVLNVHQDDDSMKRLHAGLEFNFADFFFLRAGMNQRYWTTGLEFATERFQLQAASYGEEIGTANANREDRRFVGKFAIRF